jgi:hypothetical protein
MTPLETILGRANKAPVPVATPEWPELDGTLSVRKLSSSERVAFDAESSRQEANSGAAFVTFAAAYCLVLADGSRAFADGDWKTLVDDPGSGSVIDRAFETADDVNVLSTAARERLKKKFVTAPDSASSLTSPATPASP